MTDQNGLKHPFKTEKITSTCTVAQAFLALPGSKKAVMECLAEDDRRFSFICANPYQELKGDMSTSTLVNHVEQTNKTYHDNLLKILKDYFPKKDIDLPFPFIGGALGYIGYDNGRYMLGLDEELPDDLHMPDIHLLFYRDIIVFDHAENCIYLLVIQTNDENTNVLNRRLADLRGALRSADRIPVPIYEEKVHFIAEVSKQTFESKVEMAQKQMKEQDISQVVLSQRMRAAFPGDPFHFYLKLRDANPSPYMFYVDFEDYLVLGSSPESLLKTRGGQVFTNPIAGTYPRGKNGISDEQLEAALLRDPKELIEHEMLIERCKLDLANVCKSASITVPRYLYIQKYEHVVHIVSDVTATLKENYTSLDALLACLPAGTVSGSPKVKAMQLISELENKKRGVYGGGIGYINFNHDINFALAIRMLTIQRGTAYLQAGAGIVAQSVPEKEYEETMHKAKSIISAGDRTLATKEVHTPQPERAQNIKRYLERLLANQDMAQHEMNDAISLIFAGNISDSQIAAFMIALGKKGETSEEIAGMAEAIREHASQSSTSIGDIMDNCGTGGDQSQSFNISTAAAFVLAGAGVKVAKHGNRSISSKTGSADVLEELGVPLDLAKEQTAEILAENNIAFLYAPHVHHKLSQITKVRKELGIPTIFNLMGPLTNPMHLSTQFMGIYRRDMLEMITETLRKLGRKRAIVINGADYMDEASLAGTNHLCLLENGKVRSFTLHPHDVGMPVYENEQIRGGSARQNARILLDVLHGKPGPCLDTVVFNAGIALFANGKATSIKEGIKQAKESIKSGAAMEKLQFLINCKNRYQSIS